MATPKLRFKEFDGDWSSQTLGNIAKFISGYAFDSEKFDENGRKLITPRNFTTYGRALFTEQNTKFTIESCDEKFVCRGNDLLILLTDLTQSCELLGKPILLPHLNEEILLNQRILKVEPNQDVIGKVFLLNFFLTENYLKHIKETSTGTTVRHSSHKILSKYEVFYPSKAEQTKIASFLSAVDEKISRLTQKHQLLNQYKQGMMQKLFSQQIRFKADDGSEFGEWEEKTIQYFLDQNYIFDQMDGNHGELYPKSEEFSDSGIPYIGATDFSNGTVNFLSCKKIPLERAIKFKKGIAKNGDVLFAHNATVGPVALLMTNLEFVILSTTATYYRCNPKKLINTYLKSVLESDYFKKQYVGIMSQSTRNQVPITTQRKLNLVVPCLEEQTKIANFLSAIDQKIEVVAEQIEQAKTWKKGLLQQMFV